MPLIQPFPKFYVRRNQLGYGGLRFLQGPRVQEGRGVGSFFVNLLKSLFKVGKKAATSDVGKSVIKEVGQVAASKGTALLSDVIKGKNVKDSAIEHLKDAKTKISDAVVSAIPKAFTANSSKKRKSTATTTTVATNKKRKRKKTTPISISTQKRKKDIFG